MNIANAENRFISKGLKVVALPLPTKYFTGRDEYLKSIEAIFGLPQTSIELGRQRIFVLYGTGGMGKTQLALKFLEKYGDKYVY